MEKGGKVNENIAIFFPRMDTHQTPLKLVQLSPRQNLILDSVKAVIQEEVGGDQIFPRNMTDNTIIEAFPIRF